MYYFMLVGILVIISTGLIMENGYIQKNIAEQYPDLEIINIEEELPEETLPEENLPEEVLPEETPKEEIKIVYDKRGNILSESGAVISTVKVNGPKEFLFGLFQLY